jgi:hypothetical protein
VASLETTVTPNSKDVREGGQEASPKRESGPEPGTASDCDCVTGRWAGAGVKCQMSSPEFRVIPAVFFLAHQCMFWFRGAIVLSVRVLSRPNCATEVIGKPNPAGPASSLFGHRHTK